MLSTLDPNARRFLNSLERIQVRMDRAQSQISTGMRVTKVSDDPDQISTLLTARAHLESAQQVKFNLGRVKGEVDGAEQSMQSAVQLFERVRTLTAQGNTGTATTDSRAVLAQEIGAIMEQMSGLAGTAVEGRYIFSGDSDQTRPFSVDLTLPTPVSAYQGSAATRQILHPNGTTFTIAHSGQEIFASTDPTKNVFAAMNAVRVALLADDSTAIKTAYDAMLPVSGHLNSQLAFYGSAQNKVSEALDFGEQLQVQLKSQITSIQEADLTDAILELQQSQTQQQAAMESYSRLPRTTLFDYLK